MTFRTISDEIDIRRDTATVFAYVTCPTKWHEWFPSSTAISDVHGSRGLGERFIVPTMQRPINWLPLTLRRDIAYEVTVSEPPRRWRIVAHSDAVNTDTEYLLTAISSSTRFTRLFRYEAKGLFAVLEPLLLREQFILQSRLALANLQRILQSGSFDS